MPTDLDPAFRDLAAQVADHVARQLRTDPPIISPWLTPSEAADYLRLDARSLETMRREGRGPKFSKVNHRIVRYHVDDLDAWLREPRDETELSWVRNPKRKRGAE
mgnify:CR=1 FL=1